MVVWNRPQLECKRPTRLSSPPPRRSTAPICIPEVGAGVVAGGVRSRLRRSPKRSPWDGMTAGGASETPAVETVSGLSTLSPLNKTETHYCLHLLLSFSEEDARLRSTTGRKSFVLNTTAALNKGTGGLVVDRGQSTNMADKLLQQCGFNQICLFWNQWLLSQNHFFSSHRICGQQTPIDVTAVPEVRVIRVLRRRGHRDALSAFSKVVCCVGEYLQTSVNRDGGSEIKPLLTCVARLNTCCTSSWVSVGFFRNSFTIAVRSCSCTYQTKRTQI